MPSRVTGPRGFLRGLATTSGPPRPGEVGLADDDADTFGAALGDQIVTGPSLTNMYDFRAIVIT